MDVNKENRKKESTADWILNLDFNPEGVIHPSTKKFRKTSFKENVKLLKCSCLENHKCCSCSKCQEKPVENICYQELNVLAWVNDSIWKEGFFFSIHTSSRVRVLSLKKTVVPAMDSFHIANWMKWIIFQFQEPSSGVLMSKSHLDPQTAPVGMQLSWK